MVNRPIIAIALAKNPKRKDQLLLDPFFSSAEQLMLKDKVKFVHIDHLSEEIEQS